MVAWSRFLLLSLDRWWMIIPGGGGIIRPVCQYALELNDMILNEIVID